MVPIPSLWLPILLSALLVFLVSALIHMFLNYHANDYRKLPDEGAFADALRRLAIPPGQYVFPRAVTSSDMKSPEFQEKVRSNPGVLLTTWPAGNQSMGANFVQWLLYSVVVGIFAAYITGRALGPGAPYLEVFRFAGATAFFSYSTALWQDSIWFKRSWSSTLRHTLDGLIYALLTAGVFGWLWPQ